MLLFIDTFDNSWINTDHVLADLTLGPTEHGVQGLHWRKMMDQPGERIFVWHTVHSKE